MSTVKFVSIETHADIFAFDPLPCVTTKRYDGCTTEAIVAAVVDEYKDDLISVVTYDISVATINGVKYKSEPLNKRRWSRKE